MLIITLPTVASNLISSVSGTMVVGRLLDEFENNRINVLTRSKVRFEKFNQVSVVI